LGQRHEDRQDHGDADQSQARRALSWVFGELDGFSPTIVEVDWRACRARMQESSRALDQGESMDLSTLT
jgi:hypothetical protein